MNLSALNLKNITLFLIASGMVITTQNSFAQIDATYNTLLALHQYPTKETNDDEIYIALDPRMTLAFTDVSITKSVKHHKAMKESRPSVLVKQDARTLGRESITFLLGETFNPRDPIYKEAFKFYCNHPQERTAYIITHCRSILEVRNYLAQNPTSNGLPWGKINVVVQGDDWTGLNTSIYPQGKKATLRNLLTAVEQQNFPALISPQIDQHSTLHLHGVKASKQERLVRSLSMLLFDEKAKTIDPILVSSPGILYFEPLATRE